MSRHTSLRETPFGQLTRLITGNRFFKYPEEVPGFLLPWKHFVAADDQVIGREDPDTASEMVTTPFDVEKQEDDTDIDKFAQIATTKTIDNCTVD